jgi:hypothetical protein
MKALLCCLFLVTFTGATFAQAPMMQGTPQALPVPGMPLAPAQPMAQAPMTHGAVMGAPVAAPGNCCPPANCCQPCQSCQPCKTCVREPAVTKINRVCYGMVCEEFCLPRCSCSCFSHLCGGHCGDCGGLCEGPRAKYILVKKVRVEECPTTRCVPSFAPACGNCGGLPCR